MDSQSWACATVKWPLNRVAAAKAECFADGGWQTIGKRSLPLPRANLTPTAHAIVARARFWRQWRYCWVALVARRGPPSRTRTCRRRRSISNTAHSFVIVSYHLKKSDRPGHGGRPRLRPGLRHGPAANPQQERHRRPRRAPQRSGRDLHVRPGPHAPGGGRASRSKARTARFCRPSSTGCWSRRRGRILRLIEGAARRVEAAAVRRCKEVTPQTPLYVATMKPDK